MRKLILYPLFCIIAVSANATNWVQLENYSSYIDTDSVSIFNENTQVVTAFFKNENMSSIKLKSKNRIVDSIREQSAFNCKNKTSSVIAGVEYDSNKMPINSFSNSIYGPFSVIHPETLGDHKMKAACRIAGFR